MRSWMAAAKRFTTPSQKKSKPVVRRALGSRIGLEPLEERAMLAVFHVALSGNDGNDGSAATPFRTIQQAIDAASAADDGDDIIRVAGGTYDEAGVDIGFTINADAELDSLDISGSWDATFTTQDTDNTPTIFAPSDAGGQVNVLDDDVTLEAIGFMFDGTNTGISVGANNFRLDTVGVTGAFDGVAGDSLTAQVSIDDSLITGNLGTGVKFTNMTGDLIVNGTEISDNGINGIDFEGSNAFVSIQGSTLKDHLLGTGAKIVNPGGQVAVGNNSAISGNLAGLVVEGASSLAVDATDIESNTLNGITAKDVTGQVSITGATTLVTNGFIGAQLTNIGSLEVDNIEVNDNSAGGLIAAQVAGAVEITNSTFSGNSTGIGIAGANGVTISGTSASLSTTANGLTVNNGGNVSVTGGNFNTNAAIGIEIKDSNDVTLESLSASGNETNGISLNDVDVVDLTTLIVDGNLEVGLLVDEATSVTDQSSSFSSNLGSGIVLTNIAIDVSLTNSTVELNGADGFFANVVLGNITISNGTFDENDGDGVHVDEAGAFSFSAQASKNGGDGVDVANVASVDIQIATVEENTNGVGVKAVDVTGAVTVAFVDLNMNMVGLVVSTAASVSVESANIEANTLNGVDIENVAGLVEIKNSDINDNQFHGVSIKTSGSVSVVTVNVNNNSAAGLLISGITGDVDIDDVIADANSSGIAVDGAAKVTIKGVLATNSVSGSGLVINNVTGGGTSVAITDYSSFNGNAADGVRITNVVGEIILDEIEASDNVEQGIDIDGADKIELNNLTLKNNASGLGGQVVNVAQIYHNGTTLGTVADLVVVTGTSITHTRAGDAQQPINYANAFRLSISGHAGDDTVQVNGAFALGAGDGLHIFGGDDNDLIESNGVTGFGQTVPFVIRGEAGSDSLVVNTLSGFDDLVQLVSQFVLVQYGPNALVATPEVLEYDDIEEITLASAGGNDSVVVTEPVPNGQFPNVVNINGGDENDGIEINLGKPNSDVVYNIDGGAGSNGLTIFTRSIHDNNLTFTDGKVEVELRNPVNLSTVKTINYANIRGINAYADAGNDAFEVSTTFTNGLQRLSLFGQGDQDLVNVHLDDPTLASLVEFDGGAGVDNRLSIFTHSGDADLVTIDSQRVRSKLASEANPNKDVNYANVQMLSVDTNDGADVVSLSQALGAPVLPALVVVDLEGGADVVNVDVANIPNSVELSLFLGGGDDTVNVTLAATNMLTTLSIDGGSEDVQDEIRVVGNSVAANNLSVGTSSSNDRIRASGIELLFMLGGAGADVFTNNTSINSILDGLGGNDTLTGGSGRDFILGEGGLDVLSALEEEDLLVSGPVSFDLHIASLFAIMSEWTSNRTFSERIANINGTGVGARNNGDVFLQPTVTVFDEGALDLLTGGTEDDWFLAQTSNDQILDQQNLDDIVTVIP
ncbi:MAG: right-handed parallel beta-helix repeat-containing protein [Pirellulales bacterium]|nr:right-handed parallel beta-helix repeat-containing protein [Pirellulales bacterium]